MIHREPRPANTNVTVTSITSQVFRRDHQLLFEFPILSIFLLKYRFVLAVETLPEPPVKEIIATDRAPRAIGPYSQAVRAGNLIFASGQIPIDPATGEFIAGGIAEQTEQVLRNLTAVFEAAAVGLDQVVKTTVFLADMNDFTAMNEVYGRLFGDNRPARSTVQAARLPRDARVEIDAIAVSEPGAVATGS